MSITDIVFHIKKKRVITINDIKVTPNFKTN